MISLQSPLVFSLSSLLLLGSTVTVPVEEVSTGVVPSEAEIKAALLYKFPQYTTWPSSSFGDKDAAFVVGVVGESEITPLLTEILSERTIGGRKVIIHSLKVPLQKEDLEKVDQCHLIFVPGADDQVEKLSEQLDDLPILLIGESDKFAQRGGHINFYFRGESIRFEINAEAIRSLDLKVSAKLLKLAKIVKTKKKKE